MQQRGEHEVLDVLGQQRVEHGLGGRLELVEREGPLARRGCLHGRLLDDLERQDPAHLGTCVTMLTKWV